MRGTVGLYVIRQASIDILRSMIIGDHHRFLFVELPRTGSTAVARELCHHYGGREILFKHATFRDFLRVASRDQRGYFVFSAIRNPLDDAVTQYFKCKTDPDGSFSGLKKARWFRRAAFSYRIRRYDFVNGNGAEFAAFFRRFYRLPYDNWSCLSHDKFDFVMRFERLQDDFARVLRRLGIEPVRPLPKVNTTRDKEKTFEAYFTPEIQEHAQRIFGPYMRKWGYEFPPHFGDVPVSRWSHVELALLNTIRKVYWKHLRTFIYTHSSAAPRTRQVKSPA